MKLSQCVVFRILMTILSNPIMKPLPLLLLLLLLLPLGGCRPDPPPLAADGAQAASRTLIVYLGGDNNLSSESFQKLEALQLALVQNPILAHPAASILVYHDPATASGALPSLWRLTTAGPQLIQRYPLENSASAEVLARVVARCQAEAPAQSYGLWLFSHASGWLPPHTLGSPRSVVVDGSSEMELADLARAIPDSTFEFIVFEACFMSGIEVAYELRHKTRYLLASSAEILSPGFTTLYGSLLPPLWDLSSQHDSQKALASVAQAYYHFRNQASADNRSATISLIRTAPLEPLAAQLRAWGLHFPRDPQTLLAIQHFDRHPHGRHLFFDLRHLLQTICTPAQMTTLDAMLSRVVLLRLATPTFMPSLGGFTIHSHSGLTTYIPQPQYPYLNSAYRSLDWAQATEL